MSDAIIEFAANAYRIVARLKPPPNNIQADYRQRARLIEDFDLGNSEGGYLFVGVSDLSASWPSLVVEQRFSPCGHGFNPGILLVPESRALFIGAGSRLLAYRLGEPPRRLWEDVADVGFWSWSRHGDVVLMSAEIELAAWSIDGRRTRPRPLN
jgi:hypothetical protein